MHWDICPLQWMLKYKKNNDYLFLFHYSMGNVNKHLRCKKDKKKCQKKVKKTSSGTYKVEKMR